MKVYTTSQRSEDVFFSPDLSTKVVAKFITALPLITRFCRENHVSLERVDTTEEKGYEELLCVFNDEMGGYTVQALRDSLA